MFAFQALICPVDKSESGYTAECKHIKAFVKRVTNSIVLNE